MANPFDRAARSLARNLHQLPNPFTASDFKSKNWAGLATSEDRKEALAMLVARGYLSVVKTTVENNTRSMVVYYKNELLGDE